MPNIENTTTLFPTNDDFENNNKKLKQNKQIITTSVVSGSLAKVFCLLAGIVVSC